jgi:hypothetical protein
MGQFSKCIKMKQWLVADDCYCRCVWVEILGLPPQAWCIKNFEQVVSNIGKIEWIKSDTISCKSMDSGKMLIVTELLSFIENPFLL